MSQDGQRLATARDPDARVVVVTFPMASGDVFDWHEHSDHQLAWAERGVLTVRSGTSAWVLPPTRALWIPAGVRHETLSAGATTMRTAYVRAERYQLGWTECTPVTASPLMAELIGFLETAELELETRAHAETLLVDLLNPVETTPIDVRMPTERRARRVAEALVADPTNSLTLGAWGRELGASGRTLARLFLSETGVPFGRWRTMLRLRTGLGALAAGAPVASVAARVGYESASAFVAAFHRETGVTPSSYFRSAAEPPAGRGSRSLERATPER